jgi:hypothetical protein
VFLLAGAVVAWIVLRGGRRGVALAAISTAVAALAVAPWTVRNAIVEHGFIPISTQDAAAYGTFNAESAHDPVWPYAWRPIPRKDRDLFNRRHPLSDVAWRAQLNARGRAYILAHPASVPTAFFWNGLSRLWDVRHRSRALDEVHFEGRSRLLTSIGLDAYLALLPLALVGLWRARKQRTLLGGVIAIALAASVVYTIASGTRYRACLEPLIAVLACAGALGTGRVSSSLKSVLRS